MTKLLTPEEVREMLVIIDEASTWPYEKTPRLCRDYLTLREAAEHLFEASGADNAVADLDEYLEIFSHD